MSQSALVEEIKLHKQQFEQELCGDILPFWMKHGVKPGKDGFYGAADLQGNPVESNLSCVLTARILWTYSEASVLYPDNRDYPVMAHLAYKVLQEKFLDPDFGGYYMEIAPDGTVASDIKHTYAQAFVIYALSKYMEYVQNDKILGVIRGFFMLLESKAKDTEHEGYFEAFTRDWSVYQENRMADHNEPRSMNTHLHVMEAYAALFKVWSNERVRIRLTGLLELFIGKIIRQNGHLGIFFDEDFNEVDSSKGICSFGHEIEASWLLVEASEILNNRDILQRMKPLCLKMADAVAREGVDQDGGLFLESTRFGSHLRTNKHWWPQAETLVGFMNAFEMTRDQKYWELVKLSWNFINTHLIDHQYGEWYTKVNRLGIPYLIEPADDPSPYYRNDWKIDPWKCPYHNGRAMMEMMKRCESISKSIQ